MYQFINPKFSKNEILEETIGIEKKKSRSVFFGITRVIVFRIKEVSAYCLANGFFSQLLKIYLFTKENKITIKLLKICFYDFENLKILIPFLNKKFKIIYVINLDI